VVTPKGETAADQDDRVLSALSGLVEAINTNAVVNKDILRRARQLETARRRGKSWKEITDEEDKPLIIEMLRGNQERLAVNGSRFRREQAKALREEGLTMDEIAALFGVTRPRIIALLKEAAH
jgi:hypothetical protein